MKDMTDITDLAKEIEKVYPIWINMINANAAHPGYSIELLEKGVQLAQKVIDFKQNPNWCLGCGPDNCTGCGGPLEAARQEQKEKDAQIIEARGKEIGGAIDPVRTAKAIRDS